MFHHLTYIELIKWLKRFFLILATCSLVAMILLAEQRNARQLCKNIKICVQQIDDQAFVGEAVIKDYLQTLNMLPTLGKTPFSKLSVNLIQKSLQANPFIRCCNVYKTINGTLVIQALSKRAIARFLSSDAEDCYIDEKGYPFPLSKQYAPRIILVEFEKESHIMLHNTIVPISPSLVKLFISLQEDPFFKTEIVHAYINQTQQITLATHFAKHKIFLGNVEEKLTDKLEKIKIFYKEILPQVGWNTYKRINLCFDKQIVCE